MGLGQWFRYFTGAVELAGVLLMVRPWTVSYGAALLALVSVGAFVAQLAVLHGDVIHAIVLALVLGAIAYAYFSRRRW